MENIIFFGSDQYSLIVLKKLVASSYQPVVVTDLRHDNPLIPFATEHSLRVIDYRDITALPPASLGILASFGHILKGATITHFARGILCLHPSLLPQFRNVAPAPYAIALGEIKTGITLFRIGEGIDNGQILAQIEEPISATDTTPHLLTRLFEKGVDLVINWLVNPTLVPTPHLQTSEAKKLIFTHKLTRQSGLVEWPVILKLIKNIAISPLDTNNPLIKLRLTHFPNRKRNILFDLIRALDGYEKVWSIADTKKGQLQISLVLSDIRHSNSDIRVLISGKPNPISWSDFSEYYL